ncbi:hypothetical protein KPATCC21470_8015 [Kitasatospora purpeofusca]
MVPVSQTAAQGGGIRRTRPNIRKIVDLRPGDVGQWIQS